MMHETSTPRVLIVDDEEDLCQYLKLMISKKANYEVDIATDGAAAFEKIKGENYNLVISDINMPKMNGIELLTSIKNYDPDIEVIMLTGKSSLETAVQALQYKAFDYIEKPVESRKLLVAMGNALGKQRLNLELKQVLDRVSRERKELKQQVEQQAAELARKERLAITGAVAATLTSDLLGPVGEILQKLDKIQTERDHPGKVEELVKAARPSATRLHEVLEEIVAFSEQVKPSLQPINLAQFVQKLVEQQSGLHKDIRFEVSSSLEGLEFPGDAALLERVFATVIENGCDAMDNKGKLTLQAARDGGRLVVSLEDSGPGIPPDVQDKIFLPFYSTKGSKGSGLGLTIAKRIVEEHRGTIAVEGRAGQGARFIISLPVE